MPPKKKSAPEARTEAYVHPKASRTNNPDAGLHSADKVKVPPRVKYQYDPHLDPQLIWASKAERSEIEVETVSLHKHEIIRPQDVLSMVQGERAQGELFGDVRLPIHKAVEFYKHDQTWMNRMVLGDSLLVMNSLLHKEHLGGKVQMIYMDPPYGIAYNSNFQPRIDKREVQDGKDASLSREPEQIKAYRDTWTLGIHSYLSYLRDRLLLARELLTESGSIFVQISDENVHRVRMILDEIFDSDNFIATITFAKTSGSTEKFISQTNDFILWFAKSAGSMKYRALYLDKEPGAQGGTGYTKVELADGSRRGLSAAEKSDNSSIPPGAKIYTLDNITSQSIGREKGEGAACWFPVELNGRRYLPPEKARWKTNESGMIRLASERRIDSTSGGKLGYVRYLSDFPYFPLGASWTDTIGQNQTGGDKLYVVQTALKAVQRCLLMTTDPGDLVLDPTCGSGTTAYVAEQWGRRWITCDTSRVALSLARQRLMTATFPFYELAYPKEGVAGGFKYKTVPHVTLKSIAQNLAPEIEQLYDQPVEHKHITRVAGPFSVEAIAALDPAEAMTPAPAVHPATPLRRVDRAQQLFDVLARDGGLNVPGKGRIELEGLRRLMEVDGLDAEATITLDTTMRLAVAFGPYHGPVTANRVEDAVTAAKAEGYDALAVAGFSFDPEVSAFLDKHPQPRGAALPGADCPRRADWRPAQGASRREALRGDGPARLRRGEGGHAVARDPAGRRPVRPDDAAGEGSPA
jgi:adenine-specific DNA-methyltransferase